MKLNEGRGISNSIIATEEIYDIFDTENKKSFDYKFGNSDDYIHDIKIIFKNSNNYDSGSYVTSNNADKLKKFKDFNENEYL